MYLRNLTTSTIIFLSALAMLGKSLIVPKQSVENPVYKLATKFLQEYICLLESPQSTEVSDKIRRTKENGLKYIAGSDNVMKSLSGEEDFSISFDNGYYSVIWTENGKNKVSCTFPANIGLLTFCDKIDLENQLIDRLSDMSKSEIRPMSLPTFPKEQLEIIRNSDYLVHDKGFYLIPRLRNQVVYKQIEASDNCILLMDNKRYLLESVANTLLTGYSTYPLFVKMKVDRYGYNTQFLHVPFPVLFDVLSENGSIPYWGVESYDGENIKGLYVWRNEYGGYNHMLTLTIPVTILSKPTEINATLHSYIRTDNLKALFEEYPEI